MTRATDDRSGKAIAYHWASQVISICMEMVLPGLCGYWLDQRFKTRVLFTILGFGGGLALGMAHLLRMVGGLGDSQADDTSQADDKAERPGPPSQMPGVKPDNVVDDED